MNFALCTCMAIAWVVALYLLPTDVRGWAKFWLFIFMFSVWIVIVNTWIDQAIYWLSWKTLAL